MKIASVTLESSLTKNLGNYQSTKQSITITVELNRFLDSNNVSYVLADVFDMLNPQIEDQLRQQIIHAQRAMVTEQEGEDF